MNQVSLLVSGALENLEPRSSGMEVVSTSQFSNWRLKGLCFLIFLWYNDIISERTFFVLITLGLENLERLRGGHFEFNDWKTSWWLCLPIKRRTRSFAWLCRVIQAPPGTPVSSMLRKDIIARMAHMSSYSFSITCTVVIVKNVKYQSPWSMCIPERTGHYPAFI